MNEQISVLSKQEVLKQGPKVEIIKIPSTYEKDSLIDKKRALKRWKKSFSYYYLNPMKFSFNLREL